MESQLYPKGEDTAPAKRWGRDAFMPTNFAFLPDGGFFLADGYGAHRIHRYDRDARWLSTFGEPGTGPGQFNLPHGIALDDRPGRAPSVVVADRANKRLQWFTLEGKHLKTLEGFILPANIATRGDVMLVPDLSARVGTRGRNGGAAADAGAVSVTHARPARTASAASSSSAAAADASAPALLLFATTAQHALHTLYVGPCSSSTAKLSSSGRGGQRRARAST